MQNILAAIALCLWVESHSTPDNYNNIYGDNGHAAGCLQIHAGAIADVNRKYHTTYVWPQDAMKPETAQLIAFNYLLMWGGPVNSVENYCRIFNGGPQGATHLSTRNYWQRCKARRKELIHNNLTKKHNENKARN